VTISVMKKVKELIEGKRGEKKKFEKKKIFFLRRKNMR